MKTIVLTNDEIAWIQTALGELSAKCAINAKVGPFDLRARFADEAAYTDRLIDAITIQTRTTKGEPHGKRKVS